MCKQDSALHAEQGDWGTHYMWFPTTLTIHASSRAGLDSTPNHLWHWIQYTGPAQQGTACKLCLRLCCMQHQVQPTHCMWSEPWGWHMLHTVHGLALEPVHRADLSWMLYAAHIVDWPPVKHVVCVVLSQASMLYALHRARTSKCPMLGWSKDPQVRSYGSTGRIQPAAHNLTPMGYRILNFLKHKNHNIIPHVGSNRLVTDLYFSYA